MKNLVVLNLSESSLKDDWEGWNQINFGKKLKHLDLSCCKGIRVLHGHFSMCTSLESLNLSGSSVRRIEGLGLLKALKYLNASWCLNLETLSGLSNMTKLASCEMLREIQGLEKLESLQDLNIQRCISLRRLPDLSNLKMLKNFNGNFCEKLIEIVGLEKLESLETLCLAYWESLERLPDVSKLKNLKRFGAAWCKKLIKVEGMHKLNALEYLDLWGCISLKGVLDISNLNNLRSLSVSGLELEVKGSTLFKKLTSLAIYNCDEIQLPCGLESLETLCIVRCSVIKIQGLDKLHSLISLTILCCPCLERLSDLPNFGTLKEIRVNYCCKLCDVAALGVVESLEKLSISDCNVLREIPDLRSWKSLKELTLDLLQELTGLHGLEELKSIEYIFIKDGYSIDITSKRELKKFVDSDRVDRGRCHVRP